MRRRCARRHPLDFIARLAALVPRPRVNLTRLHGVFAPNSWHRALVTPAKRCRGNTARVADERPTPAERRASITLREEVPDTAPGVTFGGVSGFMAGATAGGPVGAAIGAGLGWLVGAEVSLSTDLGGPA